MSTAVLLIAHGSPRQAANQELFDLAARLEERRLYAHIQPAFLEGARPSIAEGIDACVAKGATRVIAIPYFLLAGKHVLQDVPAAVAAGRERHPQVEIALGRHLGHHPFLLDIALERLAEANCERP
ncbi:MAG TPA: CbiX/SirB N-terminal domain-containing protein [Bacilli bacterium]|nr:CbiX/SirB N-terminal domain-containing protein [Bacilli bacterium]